MRASLFGSLRTVTPLLVLCFLALPPYPVFASFSVLYNFTGVGGHTPAGPLTQVGSKLYGLASAGGIHGQGVLFSINPDGSNYTVHHNFLFSSTGWEPDHGLTALGNVLYGVAPSGSNSAGVVFSYDTVTDTFTVLYSVSNSEGGPPWYTPVVSGSSIFGVGYSGRASTWGTIYRVDIGVGPTVLHSLNFTNGALPRGNLVLSGSTIYGTTSGGGPFNQGVIYRVNTGGTDFTILHVFTNAAAPKGGLTLAGNTLYGMAGGGTFGYGQIFRIQTDGTGFAKIHDFNFVNGSDPIGAFAVDGNTLYGMTNKGGTNDNGIVFSINTDGTGFEVLHRFAGGARGRYPGNGAPLILGTNLFGTTSSGGTTFSPRHPRTLYCRLVDYRHCVGHFRAARPARGQCYLIPQKYNCRLQQSVIFAQALPSSNPMCL